MQKYDDLPRCNSQQTNGFFLTLGVAKTYEYMLEEIPERLEAVDELETIVRHINEMHRVSEKLIATYPEKKAEHHAGTNASSAGCSGDFLGSKRSKGLYVYQHRCSRHVAERLP